MECMGQLASLRASLWKDENTRQVFLNYLIDVAREILQNGIGTICKISKILKTSFRII
jgi:hypothetical protein